MRNKSLTFTAAVALALSATAAVAQFGGGGKHADITVKAPAKVVAGKAFDVVVTVKVAAGYHIQANTVKEPWHATKLIVKAAGGVKPGKPVFPKSTKATIGTDTLDVFAGTVIIKVPITVDESAAGTQKLQIALDYQACNDSSCVAPDTITREVTIKVTGSKAK